MSKENTRSRSSSRARRRRAPYCLSLVEHVRLLGNKSTYRFRMRAEANPLHSIDMCNWSSFLQMESVSCDRGWGDVTVHDTVETEPGTFEEGGPATMAAFELTFAKGYPGLWSVLHAKS